MENSDEPWKVCLLCGEDKKFQLPEEFVRYVTLASVQVPLHLEAVFAYLPGLFKQWDLYFTSVHIFKLEAMQSYAFLSNCRAITSVSVVLSVLKNSALAVYGT